MATLTEVSVVARKGVVVGIGFVILLMFYPIIRGVAMKIYQKYNPPPPPAPTVKFGKLPVLEFPNISYPNKPEIKLETISGGLPKLPPAAKVYLVEINKSRLLTLDRYRQKATGIGLSSDPVQIDDIRYRFVHTKFQANMVVNLITDQIEYKYDWTKDKDEIIPGNLEPMEQEISKAKSFFDRLGVTKEDISKGTGKVTYYAATGSAFSPINNYIDANFVRVDLFRADLDNLKFVTSGGDFSPINVTSSSTNKPELKIVAASYYYSRILGNDIFATYPLKGVEKAYQELVSGQGFIVRNVLPTAIIRKISLAYYESNNPQDYIQPVYVFEGDKGFLAYVTAVDESMLVTAK